MVRKDLSDSIRLTRQASVEVLLWHSADLSVFRLRALHTAQMLEPTYRSWGLHGAEKIVVPCILFYTGRRLHIFALTLSRTEFYASLVVQQQELEVPSGLRVSAL